VLEGIMKGTVAAALFFLFASSFLLGQNLGKVNDEAASARAAAGCGPQEVEFEVKPDKKQHTSAQPEAGKALVYVFADETSEPRQFFHFGTPTTRVGLDGNWVGANHGKSYVYFPVDPGEHRLCADLQSKESSNVGTATQFKAEPGATYYFRALVEGRVKYPPSMKLEQVNSAEGQFLISASALSIFRSKSLGSKQTKPSGSKDPGLVAQEH
jgi:hypothetical protein